MALSKKNRMLIPYVITSALLNKPIKTTKGEQTREFNYILDIIDGYVLACTSKKAVGEIINIGNGKEYIIRDVTRQILTLMKSKIKLDDSLNYRSGETMHFYCSNEKAKKILKWRSKVSLEEGLAKTISWYTSKFNSGELKKWLI